MKRITEHWKYPMILLFGIGIANVGAWIYLIALNLIVLDMTGSPLAVGVLYILKPLAAIFTNVWSGSMIDRLNKRNLMVFLDLSRAVLIAVLPFLSSLWSIYAIVFIINMASSMFDPTSMTYITKLIPSEQRKRFNSLRSLVDSGGFLIGPAIAGVLFIVGTPIFAIYINAIALFLSGLVTIVMPNLEKEKIVDAEGSKITSELIIKDWKTVIQFSRQNVYVMLIVFLFSCVMVMTAAIDSLEAAFSKEVLSLTNSKYGFLVSIAGAGFVFGAIVNTVFVTIIPTSLLIGIGSLTVSTGYIIYAFSTDFLGAAIGFFVLSFSLAFANTGFHTFFQNNIPVDMMGRVGSIYGLIEAAFVILTTMTLGITAQLVSIRFSVIFGGLVMFTVTIILLHSTLQKLRAKLYQSIEQ
ncbi:MFS transporter [Alkalihalobacillus sp. AL-G]|uniref:MFS transporter n=1 Tax=Alkalihalobacillus sp. AL-G TaxID=2926399 RepID=UPI00272BA4C3|nr:MFS transporter [Alkalihalobacillus sp. AL-G]WLD95346.1 MFS transporter [Alkalihalobacillus sp. AL-G]